MFQFRIDLYKEARLIICQINIIEILNIVIFMLQLFIIWRQLKLDDKINKQSLSRDKGYFIITDTNVPHMESETCRYRDSFDLRRRICFCLSGKSDVSIKELNILVNERQEKLKAYEDLYFTLEERNNILELNLDLRDWEFDEFFLNAVIRIHLENQCGYQYTEIMRMQFQKRGGFGADWYLTKYNILFENRG